VPRYRVEYNTNRPHQSLGMAFPEDRFTARPSEERSPLQLPAVLTAATPPASTSPAKPLHESTSPMPTPMPLVLSTNGLDPGQPGR
jgi:hypothetical protein